MDEKVFISYSREDSEWANRIMDILESNGISCWMDRAGITVGGKYTREIISAIKRCEIFLLVLSPNAEKSEWVPKELGMAIQNRKYIVPVRITDFTVEEFELQLENIQIFEADSLSIDETEHALVSTIQGVLQLNAEARGGGESANPPGPAGTPPGLLQKQNKKKPKKPKSGKKGKKKWIAIAVAVIAFFFIMGQGSEEDGAKEAMGTSSVDITAMQESITELLGYVNQTEDLIAQTLEEDEALSNSKDVDALESTEKRVELSQKALSQLTELKKQAETVECADPVFAAAVKEYLSLRLDSESSMLNIRLFLKDYYTLFSVIKDKPIEDDYTSLESFYNDLNDWYQAVKEGYDAITSCPSNLEPQWKKYGEILDLNESISYKLYLGNGYRDFLRTTSALNLSNRFYIVEPVLFEELQSGWEDEISFAGEQSSYAAALAEELRAYAEMDGEARSSYVFQNIYTNEFLYEYQAIDTIYPSLYNTYNAFLVLRMGCISGSRDVLVEAEIEGLTQKYKERIHLNTTDQAIYIKPPALTGELDLSSAKSAQLSLTISDMDGSLIEAKTFPVTVKSKYDFEWYSNEYGVATQDNILCFLAPESEAIGKLKRQAIEEISNMTGGQMNSFVGYQSNAWNNHYVGTYLQAAGLMRAMYEMGVRYNMDPFSLSGSNQHILLPDDVLERQSGLCIETSLVIASALQSANMHAFLVLPPGHAQVAVEIWDGHGSSTAGTGQYFLIETTSLSRDLTSDFVNGANALLENQAPQSGPITYMNQDQWKQYLAVEGTYLIDCGDASIMGLTPFAN